MKIDAPKIEFVLFTNDFKKGMGLILNLFVQNRKLFMIIMVYNFFVFSNV